MKNALVIGGLSGIGKGMANALASYYDNVFIADIRVQPQDVTDRLLYVDALDVTAVTALRLQLSTIISHIDALVITIGVIDEGCVTQVPPEKWEWMLKSNLLGSVLLVDAFLPMLTAGTEARIMLTGSGCGWGRVQAAAGLGLYTVTKHAMNGYYKALKAELAPQHIQVSLLVPSAVKGNLAIHSAAFRTSRLGEPYADNKGQQPAGRVLADADEAGRAFVADFVAGKAIITNNAEQLRSKGMEDLEDVSF
ncbi:NAD(P)-dependent dehydrogenase (short-subunit alcohol dehydrogenase family) [Filimonas zeae]|uniref:3-hydroxybutyrate dehydrogenase n=1 Tax=Filimonas zeae TaxID=1737353 RepID=A0A917MSL5_9BACT|nr:SDR family NAD(P)-dependent oxidoreductase [Filimonas zeae]MDR6338120.1 NAD(P)-dependent dehydrogenase (short-subunit alcohol dehydrogenase family) [Filimonas zeae]GGH61821.1 3-hydroxybutyrate dehydrogenase [Filimonas zeae]